MPYGNCTRSFRSPVSFASLLYAIHALLQQNLPTRIGISDILFYTAFHCDFVSIRCPKPVSPEPYQQSSSFYAAPIKNLSRPISGLLLQKINQMILLPETESPDSFCAKAASFLCYNELRKTPFYSESFAVCMYMLSSLSVSGNTYLIVLLYMLFTIFAIIFNIFYRFFSIFLCIFLFLVESFLYILHFSSKTSCIFTSFFTLS